MSPTLTDAEFQAWHDSLTEEAKDALTRAMLRLRHSGVLTPGEIGDFLDEVVSKAGRGSS